ncbi:glucose/galactose transporter [Parapedobacter indicus]|uniref:Glucose/galactose transporter n=3 Tax=Parapedobacter indicus TaxID=1477437 RepID=A0A1I3GPI0_9SPHI|nr:glucose/galactose transporter [Parapedobacter indicus]SFI25395.1 glucose/galactose transporter [Parapedobacter indicus]
MFLKSKFGPMAIIGLLFFVFGFVSWLNAILIPYFKFTLQLSLASAMLVAFAFYLSYFFMAIPSSWVLHRLGFKSGMTWGLYVMAIGSVLFIPAAYLMSFPVFLIGLFIQATGLTILQTAANPYVTILGSIESAATRMSVMGICNKVAGAVAPLIFLRVVTKGPSEIDEIQARLVNMPAPQQETVLSSLTDRLIMPYGAMTLILVALGILIFRSGLPDIQEDKSGSDEKVRLTGLFKFPQLILGFVAIFCSVGVEVLVIDSIISYAEFHTLPFAEASYFPTYILLLMIASYALGIWLIPKYISQRNTLVGCASFGIIVTAAAISFSGSVSIWMVVLLGLANALIWPSIWPLALDGVGNYTKQGSALLVMGVAGGAIIPYVYGALGSWLNPQLAYVIMVPLYIFLLYFAGWGRRKARRNLSVA